jgi:hypothetical protein
MTYVQPPKGSRVRVTVEGEVADAGDADTGVKFLCIGDGLVLEWEQGSPPPSVQILAPSFRPGDVGSYTDSTGKPRTVFYMALPGKMSGWYDAQGVQIHFDINQYPQMVVRCDGILLKEITR